MFNPAEEMAVFSTLADDIGKAAAREYVESNGWTFDQVRIAPPTNTIPPVVTVRQRAGHNVFA